MNTWHLLQITFAALGVVTALILVAGLIVKWRFAMAWRALGDLLLYGVCGMFFGLAMASGIVGVVEFVLHLFISHATYSLCLPGTTACTSTTAADLRDIVARIFLTGTALLGTLSTMCLQLGVIATISSKQPVR